MTGLYICVNFFLVFVSAHPNITIYRLACVARGKKKEEGRRIREKRKEGSK